MDKAIGVETIILPERFHYEQVTNTVLQLQDSIGQNRHVILDFSKLKYIDSSGVTVLLACNKSAKAQGVTLTLRGMNSEVRSFFAMTCLDQLFMIE